MRSTLEGKINTICTRRAELANLDPSFTVLFQPSFTIDVAFHRPQRNCGSSAFEVKTVISRENSHPLQNGMASPSPIHLTRGSSRRAGLVAGAWWRAPRCGFRENDECHMGIITWSLLVLSQA